MKKILVTGATGFIGNHLIPELLKSGHEIIASGRKNKEELNSSWIDEVIYIKHDLNEIRNDCYNFFHKPDKLIHLSWEGLPNYTELFHFEKNLFSSYSFIKNFVLSGCRDVTAMGTCFEYGMREGKLSENMLSMPANSYSLAKDTLRKFLEELKSHHPFKMKWIRLFYLLGQGQGKTSILGQLKTAIERNEKEFNMSPGEQLRDYLPVETVAKHITKISLNNDITGIVNCCSGKPISIRKLVEEYLETAGVKIKLNLGYFPYSKLEPMAFWGSTEKLFSILQTPENTK